MTKPLFTAGDRVKSASGPSLGTIVECDTTHKKCSRKTVTDRCNLLAVDWDFSDSPFSCHNPKTAFTLVEFKPGDRVCLTTHPDKITGVVSAIYSDYDRSIQVVWDKAGGGGFTCELPKEISWIGYSPPFKPGDRVCLTDHPDRSTGCRGTVMECDRTDCPACKKPGVVLVNWDKMGLQHTEAKFLHLLVRTEDDMPPYIPGVTIKETPMEHFNSEECAILRKVIMREQKKQARKGTVLRYGIGLLGGAAFMWLAGTMGWI